MTKPTANVPDAPRQNAPAGKKARLPNLNTIEITSAGQLQRFVAEARDTAREFGGELDWAAEELQAVLVRAGKGNPWLMGVDVKLRAKRVSNRARRAAELQRGAGVEMVKLWQEFLIQFAPALEQNTKAVKTFDFDN
ncbi:MAG: hypothetical protein ABWX68_08265 [Arthrobacter sp.]|uniref:hypothetical protein n=1 Tax=Arthrobacter sp. TaxID=1667 RepID=UPI00348F8DBC